MPVNVGEGGGGGGGSLIGVLRFGPDQNNFADNTARDTYASANPTWLAQYDDDDSLAHSPSEAQLQRRVSGAWTALTTVPCAGIAARAAPSGLPQSVPALISQAEADRRDRDERCAMWSQRTARQARHLALQSPRECPLSSKRAIPTASAKPKASAAASSTSAASPASAPRSALVWTSRRRHD